MTVASTNTNSTAYAYLQSLLQTGASNGASATSDPMTSLMNSFYPASPSGQTTGADTPPPMPSGPTMSPDAMSALLTTQEQGASASGSHAQKLFAAMDTDGDGKVSQTEFENVFGPNADKSKVDGLFNALDSNSDGSVSTSEFASAVQTAQAQHGAHHHRHHHAEGSSEGGGGSDPLQQLLNGTSVTGAKSTTTTSPDGSSTTTITYADGSTVSSTTPATSSSGSNASGQNSTSNSNGSSSSMNALEQLIKMQAQFVSRLAAPPANTLATV